RPRSAAPGRCHCGAEQRQVSTHRESLRGQQTSALPRSAADRRRSAAPGAGPHRGAQASETTHRPTASVVKQLFTFRAFSAKRKQPPPPSPPPGGPALIPPGRATGRGRIRHGGPPMKTAIVIPARYASSRLPGKPLLRQTGKYLVQHVYERACQAKCAAAVVVATDDSRIVAAVKRFGGRVLMTRRDHRSGTDLGAEIADEPDAQLLIKF